MFLSKANTSMLFPTNACKKWLYVLRLENKKYYVGVTNNLGRRLNQHANNAGSQWTKLHKPVALAYLRSNVSYKDENTITRRYMKRFGPQNVRGGRWCGVHDHRTITVRRKRTNLNNSTNQSGSDQRERKPRRVGLRG